MEFDYRFDPGQRSYNRTLQNDGIPLVSVVTPYYNAGSFIEETANCILNQTFPYFEWIIVNDGSTNEQDLQKLSELGKRDSRIKILHKENGGISTARNLGIKESTTDLIVPMDADDLIDPTYLECGYFTLHTNPGASWCYTDCVGFGKLEYLWEKPFLVETLKKDNFLVAVAMIRKSAWIEVDGYNESEKHFYEDWHFWMKLLRAGRYPVHMSFYGFWYRRLDDGVLGLVKKHPDKHKRAMEMIGEVAKDVDPSIKAIEFPNLDSNHFSKPDTWLWDRKPILKSDKSKVLFLIPWLNVGGADKFNLDLISRMDKDRFEVSILTTVPSDNPWRQKFEKHVTDIFDLTSFLHTRDWAAFVHYFIKSRNIDVVFISNSYYSYYLTPWLKEEFPNLPVVDYVHSEEWHWRNGGFARISAAFSPYLNKTYVCTNHLKKVMVDTFGRHPEGIDVVHINVDESEEYNPAKHQKGVIRSEIGISQEVPVVLFPCRIHAIKRPFLMLEIAKNVKQHLPSVQFWVVGDGPDLPRLKKETEVTGLNDTIHFFGKRSDMPHFYADANVTLICSLKEGLSLTSYESLSMGVPVVSADVGGQKELIDSEVGSLIPLMQHEIDDYAVSSEFKKEEVDLYVLSIKQILTNTELQKSFQKNARERIENNFGMHNMIERMEKEFNFLKVNDSQKAELSGADKMNLQLAEELLVIFNEYEGKYWQLHQLQSGKHGTADDYLAELKGWIRMLEAGKDWLEQQLKSRDKELEKLYSLHAFISKFNIRRIIRKIKKVLK